MKLIRIVRKIWLLSTFLWLPAWHEARALAFEIQCEPPESLDGKIELCSDNDLAAESAANCGRELLRAISEAAPELGEIFATAESGGSSRQKENFQFSAASYEKAQAKLEYLIEQSSFNMHLLAAYPQVMLDDLDVGLDSVACYKDNFETINGIVQDLDNKITELKKAKKFAEALRSGTQIRAENVGAMKPDSMAKSKEIVPATALVRRWPENAKSDITGLAAPRTKEQSSSASQLARDGLKTKLPGEMRAGSRSAESQILESFSAKFGEANASVESENGLTKSGAGSGISTIEAAPRKPASIGALIWSAPADPSKKELELAVLSGAGSNGESAGKLLPPDLQNDPFSSPEIGSRDLTLFQIIHNRYRATDLFRDDLPGDALRAAIEPGRR